MILYLYSEYGTMMLVTNEASTVSSRGFWGVQCKCSFLLHSVCKPLGGRRLSPSCHSVADRQGWKTPWSSMVAIGEDEIDPKKSTTPV